MHKERLQESNELCMDIKLNIRRAEIMTERDIFSFYFFEKILGFSLFLLPMLS